jgi:hypothetical protein
VKKELLLALALSATCEYFLLLYICKVAGFIVPEEPKK